MQFLMERAMRLELTTLCLEGRCSSQLSYARVVENIYFLCPYCETYLMKISLYVKGFFKFF